MLPLADPPILTPAGKDASGCGCIAAVMLGLAVWAGVTVAAFMLGRLSAFADVLAK